MTLRKDSCIYFLNFDKLALHHEMLGFAGYESQITTDMPGYHYFFQWLATNVLSTQSYITRHIIVIYAWQLECSETLDLFEKNLNFDRLLLK